MRGLSLVFLQNITKLMQNPRQSGGPRGWSKVELIFLVFHPDLTLTFRLYIFSASQSVREWNRQKLQRGALALASWVLKVCFAKCRKQEVLCIVLLLKKQRHSSVLKRVFTEEQQTLFALYQPSRQHRIMAKAPNKDYLFLLQVL